jgi:hypothetical protein
MGITIIGTMVRGTSVMGTSDMGTSDLGITITLTFTVRRICTLATCIVRIQCTGPIRFMGPIRRTLFTLRSTMPRLMLPASTSAAQASVSASAGSKRWLAGSIERDDRRTRYSERRRTAQQWTTAGHNQRGIVA